MQAAPITRTFKFEATDTCKRAWTFSLHRHGGDLIIDELRITDDLRSNGEIQGCHGHPKTIVALLKGRTIASIDMAALAVETCPRNKSCGRALAECLQALQSTETPAWLPTAPAISSSGGGGAS